MNTTPEIELNEVIYGGKTYKFTDWGINRYFSYMDGIKGYHRPKDLYKTAKKLFTSSILVKGRSPKIIMPNNHFKIGEYFYNDDKRVLFICWDNLILNVEKLVGSFDMLKIDTWDYQNKSPFVYKEDIKPIEVDLMTYFDPYYRRIFNIKSGKSIFITKHSIQRFIERHPLKADINMLGEIREMFEKAFPIRFSKGHNVLRLLNNGLINADYFFESKCGWTFVLVKDPKGRSDVMTTIERHPEWSENKDYIKI